MDSGTATVAIILVDATLLNSAVSGAAVDQQRSSFLGDAIRRLSQAICDQVVGEEKHPEQAISGEEYSGHYIVLTEYLSETNTFGFLDPAKSAGGGEG